MGMLQVKGYISWCAREGYCCLDIRRTVVVLRKHLTRGLFGEPRPQSAHFALPLSVLKDMSAAGALLLFCSLPVRSL